MRLLKTNYIGPITILICLITFLFFSSYYPGQLNAGFYTFRKSGLKSYFAKLSEDKSAVKIKKAKKDSPSTDSLAGAPRKPKVDTSAQRIMFIGDSMLEGLSKRMIDYCAENNHELTSLIWYSSNTNWWGRSDTLDHFIKTVNPTYIIFAIGSGDISVQDVVEKRKPYVDEILKKIGDLPYVWVGPPNWKEDTGINQLIEESVEEGTFFLSKDLKFERTSDGVHPTTASAGIWMDSIASFIVNKSKYPIRLNFPQSKTKKKPTYYLFPPKPPVD